MCFWTRAYFVINICMKWHDSWSPRGGGELSETDNRRTAAPPRPLYAPFFQTTSYSNIIQEKTTNRSEEAEKLLKNKLLNKFKVGKKSSQNNWKDC